MNRPTPFFHKYFPNLTSPIGLPRWHPELQALASRVLPVLVGFSLGALVLFSRELPTKWGTLLLLLVPAFTGLMLMTSSERMGDPRKIVLVVAFFVGIALNLDVGVATRLHPGRMTLSQWRISVVAIAVIIGYAFWLLEGVQEREAHRPRLFASVTLPAVGWLLAGIISAFKSADVTLSIFWIVYLAELILTFFYVANQIRTRDDLNFVVTIVMICFLFESGLMVLQYFTGFSFSIAGVSGGAWGMTASGQRRVTGTLGHANAAGLYTASNLVIALGAFLSSTKRSEKYLAAFAVGLGTIALIATFSRSSWEGFLLAAIGFMVVGFVKGHIKLETIMIFLVLFLVVFLAFYEPIMTRVTSEDNSTKSRPTMAKLAQAVISANLVWGVGANNYGLVADKYAPPGFDSSPYADVYSVGNHPVHNTYLLIWAETGLPGIASFVALLLMAALQGIQAARLPDKRISLLAMALFFALGVFAVGVTTHHLVNRTKMRWLWGLIALLVGVKRVAKVEEAQNCRSAEKGM